MSNNPMANPVTAVLPAEAAGVIAHGERRLSLETDCWDVHSALSSGEPGFVLLDVRPPAAFAEGHVPGAINLPRGKMVEGVLRRYPRDTLFVVYCAGPHCNGSTKAAVQLARMGRRVKEMIGGVVGWHAEGFAIETT